jgi:hypothetical protein
MAGINRLARVAALAVLPLMDRFYRWKWRSSGPNLSACRVCITFDDGCCVFPLWDEWKIVLLPAEIRRISEFTGKAASEFIDITPLTLPQLEDYIDPGKEDPLWARLFSLWTQPSGFKDKCPFVMAEGCSLPYHVKPFLCQAYPLDFNITAGTISVPEETDCHVLQSSGSLHEALACFGDDLYSLQRRFEEFRQDFILLLNTLDRGETAKNNKFGKSKAVSGA